MPVNKEILPVEEPLLVPVVKIIGPLSPASPEFAVVIDTAPLVPKVLNPLAISTFPPVKSLEVVPALTTMRPPTPELPRPTIRVTSPLLLCAESPVFMETLPDDFNIPTPVVIPI